ncbi:alpha/beta fold hydrolase [Sulfitobacter sabulilitoris]|uniref:Alpha/beta fold hydrolase n=1 Tax=Sulfitobacter sabulilitoris TaxID=2562655 RepID=A0A5S3PB83_9RHOB|nr:alpha/beta hydrolase [Sulfitobacter sabulilitoris]TMM50858.1 alpha/beta fold hydrolase [Sulfitobacter sabulilitoris]
MAEPLVLLPGMMCDARLYGPQIAELSADTAVMVAPITNGERIEEIASSLLDQLPQRFALAGLSMGGIVAMELLRRAPDRITRIALMGTSPLAETPQIAAAREPNIVAARTGRLAQVMRDEMKPHYLAPGAARDEVLDLVVDMAETLGPEVFVRQSRALQRRRDQQATLRRCKVPALVLCGAHDALCPVKRHSFMAELIPYAKLVVLDHAGHLPTLELPAETTRALRDWMSQPYVLT